MKISMYSPPSHWLPHALYVVFGSRNTTGKISTRSKNARINDTASQQPGIPAKALLICTLAACLCFAPFSAYAFQQHTSSSAACPRGSASAQESFETARAYHFSAKGHAWNLPKAEQLYRKALDMGNAEAAIGLGRLHVMECFYTPMSDCRRDKIQGYCEQAIDMGCPEGLLFLAEMYENGWGVKQDIALMEDALVRAVEARSPAAMVRYAELLLQRGQTALARQQLEQSLALGNGEAGYYLALLHILHNEDPVAYITALRDGARLGSARCLLRLSLQYKYGWYGQSCNLDLAGEYEALYQQIDPFDHPAAVADFDKKFPLHPIQPYSLGAATPTLQSEKTVFPVRPARFVPRVAP